MNLRFLQNKKKFFLFLRINKLYNPKKIIFYENIVEKLYNYKNSSYKKNLAWYLDQKKKNKAIIKIKPLNNLRNWNFNKKLGVIEHDTKHFFSIIGLSVKNAGREVNSWDQPFIKQKNFVGGVIGLVRKNINGLPHYLIEAKFEPGNYNKIQLSPSVQSTYSNLSRIHKGHHNKIMNHYFFDGYTTIKKIWVSEDGGRLYNKRNLHWIINTKKNTVIKSNFKWLTLWEIQEFINNGTYVSPHLRAIISLL